METRQPQLTDIIVLDLADESAAYGTRLLAELGLRVIRVEDASGDLLRSREPFLEGIRDNEHSYAHLLYNAGKESVAIDFDSPAGAQQLSDLFRKADVVVAPLNPQGVVASALSAAASWPDGPGIIDVVFRRENPGEAANDLVATAAGGLLTLNGFPADPPNYPAGNLAYKQTGLAACHAALALVMERNATGTNPGRITISMQEAVAWTTIQTANANIWHWHGRAPTRKTPLAPFGTQKSGDGLWLSFTIHPPNWPKYADWVATELGTDVLLSEEWSDPVFRAQNGAKQAEFTARLCAKLTRAELIAEGQRRGLLVLPVNSVADIAADSHLGDRGFTVAVDSPALGREVRQPASSFLFDKRRADIRPAPALGAHTGAILAMPASPAPPAKAPLGGRQTIRHQPLAGIRILDFCWAIAGPLGTRLLADLGADVIKIESEYRIDPIRQIGIQPPGTMSWNTNGQFNNSNPNKRALTLNLNTPEGIDIVRRLAETADIVVSNYTPDRMDLWGLGYEQLRAIKPDVIVANLAVMGTTGRNKDWRSYGSGIVAMCGLADLTGFTGRDPIGLGTLHTDFTVPYFAASQIMTALLERQRTGTGQFLEISQYEASVHLLDTETLEYLNEGRLADRQGNSRRGWLVHGVYPTADDDRWIAVACRNDDEVSRLEEAIGRPAYEIALWTGRLKDREAADILQRAGVAASPVEDLSDIFGWDTGMAAAYRSLEHPSGVSVLVQEEPITWDGERLPLRRSPLWGEHTHEVLTGILGLGDEDVAMLAERNVLF